MFQEISTLEDPVADAEIEEGADGVAAEVVALAMLEYPDVPAEFSA